MIDLNKPSLYSNPIESSLSEIANYVFNYPDISIYYELKKCISNWLKVPVSCITIGNGSESLIDVITQFIKSGTVLAPIPTFFFYEFAAINHKLFFKTITWDDLKYCIVSGNKLAKEVKLVWIATPNNPTGHIVTKDEILTLIELTDAVIVIDESFIEFGGQTCSYIASKHDRVIVIRSFSKSFGLSGARVGYAISNPKLAYKLNKNIPQLSVNNISTRLAISCLNDYLTEYEFIWRDTQKQLSKFYNEIRKYVKTYPTKYGNYVSILLDSKESKKLFIQKAMNIGINLKESERKEYTGAPDGLVRIHIPKPSDQEWVLNELTKILKES